MEQNLSAALFFLFLCGMLLLSAPVTSVFETIQAGSGALPVYLFGVWLLLIIAAAWVVRRSASTADESETD
ncbi:MAG: hypothetical protein LAT75_13380 [Candidatus Cyclonatronum sp.]|uniref:hypothetical protein n=1 Tax=Cyclonatronum sp. TaxID=3024185 RepID=UPI0025C26FBF|nr:hypothetical protein [Cyclonatronum sp.]MCC5933670.1 hypothetical protein [Balneolales bacterium]MCH8487855.1 hypothetical protein [Cyclonatronum sp.]